MEANKIIHHTLTVTAFVFIPMVWVFLNIYSGRITMAKVFRAWNEQRLSEEPWGVLDRNYLR